MAEAAGFEVTKRKISLQVPVTQPAAAKAGSDAFCRMLNDWASGNLAPAREYADWLQSMRGCSLIPLPLASHHRERSEPVQQLIRKSLKGQAKFQDFAQIALG
ncbi:hypothetical protein [Modicisalibacter luteus]|uniref:Uncharacterized protein n=1 Tax=Modicisalibacter luteus TaxID=453962 RepID=A0ABV7M3U1_9GAMM|nr:hypothetical protein [Halomonas lutea]GHB14602.1 hypothetical protein GCM10007159_41230 [Halomonas lutea]